MKITFTYIKRRNLTSHKIARGKVHVLVNSVRIRIKDLPRGALWKCAEVITQKILNQRLKCTHLGCKRWAHKCEKGSFHTKIAKIYPTSFLMEDFYLIFKELEFRGDLPTVEDLSVAIDRALSLGETPPRDFVSLISRFGNNSPADLKLRKKSIHATP